MKKVTLLIAFLLISFVSFSQVINQPANWPNASWSTSGTYNASGLLGDPTVDNAFSFDDDAAGSVSDDDIASESPLIDLTPASTAGENLITISADYTHRDIGGTLAIEWWDADSSMWLQLATMGGTTFVNDYQTCSNLSAFQAGFDITGFTATQLSGFKYRYSYDDNDGWQWGWCIQNSVLTSQLASPPNCDAVVSAPFDGETGVSVDPVIDWSAATGFPDGYFVSIGTTPGGTDIVNNLDVGNVLTYSAATLAFDTTYYITITPYNGSGNATGCTSSSFTTESDPNQTVICSAGPVNTVFCYDSGVVTQYSYVSDDGSPLQVVVNAGQVENGWDEFVVLDSDGVTDLNAATPYGAGGDLTGLIYQTSGDTLTIQVTADFSISCQSSGFVPIDLSVSCATCTNPSATYALVNDCANGEQFLVEANISSLGSATSVDVTDNQGSPAQTATAAGIITMGPYPNGTDVVLTVTNNDDGNCVITSPNFNQAACPPDNDLCTLAFPIACGETDSGNTSAASDTDEPTGFCGTGTGAPGVWYSFVGTGDIVSFSLCGSTYDTKIQVWEGDCAALSCITGNDDNFAACGGLQSEVEFISTPGTQYYVYVFGFGSSVGDYTLTVGCIEPPDPPVNDECANATVIIANPDDSCTDFGSGTIWGATASAEANACGGSSDDDVWFQFDAVSENHAITLYNIVGDTQDLYHVLYEGDDCGNLVQVYCSDPNDSVANGLTIGNTYTVRVYSWTGTPLQDVTFDICVFTIPPPIYTSTDDYTVEELVQDVLIDSECNLVSNITWSTGTNFGSTNGIGYFEANGSEWPFESGLIMTSGDVNNAPGPEDETISDGSFAWPGDPDLEDAIPGLFAGDTNNASVLEFDFVPVVDQMSFDFIFAAEEYGTFQCTFTDAFAFLLTDSNGVTTNLALVPTTFDPISVLSVRDELYNAGCPSVNPEFFDKYYGEPNGLNPLISPTDFRGHTVIMTASADVIPNELYHIKLVVADDGDTLFDSAVFLAAGSFDIGDIDLGEDILLTSGNANCEGDVVTLDAGDIPNNGSISWFQDGALIDGASGSTLEVGVTGFYRAEISINGTDCTFADEVLIEFFPNPEVSFAENSIIKCANEAFALDALVSNESDPNMGPLTYIWVLDGVEVQNSSSSTYLLSETAEEEGTLTVTVVDDITGCSGQSQVAVNFYENKYCVDVPQGLSPNGDGRNDCLILDHLEDREDILKAEIFNRYGTKVYELNDYVDQWCGTDQDGKILPVGTYFYIIYFNSSREPITSWIYL
ncbi:MAG: gliding motility-associated C-terminal domain-containing protein, partial [Flavobacteriaceae bacterium]|nr:gliding motility-associated C-terminal domain-containing protein [Flavobacteriaceae bacterium]